MRVTDIDSCELSYEVDEKAGYLFEGPPTNRVRRGIVKNIRGRTLPLSVPKGRAADSIANGARKRECKNESHAYSPNFMNMRFLKTDEYINK